jgi:hypothetical protein
MGSLLETLITFVGTVLVFALAAQSIQELLKSIFAFKGRTMQSAIEGLVREATRSKGLPAETGDAILAQITARLRVLGQGGIRRLRIRLDALPAPFLQDLIGKVDPATVPELPHDPAEASAMLKAIGRQAKEWYPLAVAPVDERYRRRMRVLAFFTSAVVVVPFNLDATRLFTLAETHDTLLGCFTLDKLAQPRWWLGIFFSTVLVSMGAPFWDDLLESLFGLKKRVAASAKLNTG